MRSSRAEANFASTDMNSNGHEALEGINGVNKKRMQRTFALQSITECRRVQVYTMSTQNSAKKTDEADQNNSSSLPPKKRFKSNDKSVTSIIGLSPPNAKEGVATPQGSLLLKINLHSINFLELLKKLRNVTWHYKSSKLGLQMDEAISPIFNEHANNTLFGRLGLVNANTDLTDYVIHQMAMQEVNVMTDLAWHLTNARRCMNPKHRCASEMSAQPELIERLKAIVRHIANPYVLRESTKGFEEQIRKVDEIVNYHISQEKRWRLAIVQLESHQRKLNLDPAEAALESKAADLPLEFRFEEWSYGQLLKLTHLHQKVIEWCSSKRQGLQMLRSLYQSQLEQQELAYPFLGFNEQKEAEVSKLEIAKQALDDITNRQASTGALAPPPKVFQYYAWANLKNQTKEFMPAIFKQITSSSRSVTKRYSIDTIIFPTVKQLHRDKQDSNLFVRFEEIKKFMAILGFVLDNDVENPARRETSKFMQDLRTQVSPTRKLYPLTGLEGASCLMACHDFELQIDAAVRLPPIHVGRGIDIVQGNKGDGTKNFATLNAHLCLQQTSAKPTHSVTDIAQTMMSTREGLMRRAQVWNQGLRAGAQNVDHDNPVRILTSNFPLSRWEEKCQLNQDLWNKLNRYQDGDNWFPADDVKKLLIALKELCRAIWELHQPSQSQAGLPYDLANFCQLISSLQTAKSLHNNDSPTMRSGDRVWTCEHCSQGRVMIKAIAQQHAKDYHQYSINLENLSTSKNVYALQLTRILNELRTITQARLRSDMSALRHRTNLDISTAELTKTKVDRRNILRELSTMIADVICHNDAMKDKAFRVGTQCSTYNLIKNHLHSRQLTGEAPKGYGDLIESIHERLNQGWESGLSIPLDHRLLVLDPHIQQENKELERQPGSWSSDVRQSLKGIYYSTYNAVLQQFPQIQDDNVVSLVEFHAHAKASVDCARRAGMHEREWKKQILAKLQFGIVKATHLFNRWVSYRKKLLQSTDGQGRFVHTRDGFTLLNEYQALASFLEEDIITTIRSSTLNPSQPALPHSMAPIHNPQTPNTPVNGNVQPGNLEGQPAPVIQLNPPGPVP